MTDNKLTDATIRTFSSLINESIQEVPRYGSYAFSSNMTWRIFNQTLDIISNLRQVPGAAKRSLMLLFKLITTIIRCAEDGREEILICRRRPDHYRCRTRDFLLATRRFPVLRRRMLWRDLQDEKPCFHEIGEVTLQILKQM